MRTLVILLYDRCFSIQLRWEWRVGVVQDSRTFSGSTSLSPSLNRYFCHSKSIQALFRRRLPVSDIWKFAMVFLQQGHCEAPRSSRPTYRCKETNLAYRQMVFSISTVNIQHHQAAAGPSSWVRGTQRVIDNSDESREETWISIKKKRILVFILFIFYHFPYPSTRYIIQGLLRRPSPR